jgi:hypothetical protein
LERCRTILHYQKLGDVNLAKKLPNGLECLLLEVGPPELHHAHLYYAMFLWLKEGVFTRVRKGSGILFSDRYIPIGELHLASAYGTSEQSRHCHLYPWTKELVETTVWKHRTITNLSLRVGLEFGDVEVSLNAVVLLPLIGGHRGMRLTKNPILIGMRWTMRTNLEACKSLLSPST